jgi:hypothetical protein
MAQSFDNFRTPIYAGFIHDSNQNPVSLVLEYSLQKDDFEEKHKITWPVNNSSLETLKRAAKDLAPRDLGEIIIEDILGLVSLGNDKDTLKGYYYDFVKLSTY